MKLRGFNYKNIGLTCKHFLDYLNLVKPKAVLEALEHPCKVVWHFFSVDDMHGVGYQSLKSGAGVDDNLTF